MSLYRSTTIFLFTALLALSGFASSQEASTNDVRLVIDVSGSMKRNDPNNLRQPSVELLVELLPEQGKAGVWTFGKWVNMLVKHQEVDAKWRELAKREAQNINSVGLYTNIGTALEKAAYDLSYTDSSQTKQIILLTDGVVDIDKDPELNQREWRRIVDEVTPKLAAAGYRIHTIALSDNADRDLMNKISVATDGLADIARNADELMQVFLKAFDAAAPTEQVDLNGNQFVIDSSVEEFTALIFREKASETLALISPDKQRLISTTKESDLRWHRANNYDLITVKRPLEGTWYIEGEIAESSRITVVSNLNLLMKPLPTNVVTGDQLSIDAFLKEDGQIISNPEFLTLMTVEAELFGGHSHSNLVSVWKQGLEQFGPQGRYQADLPALENEGVYELRVKVDGKTFQRSLKHQLTLRQPFSAELRQQYREGATRYLLTVNAFHPQLDYGSVTIVASIKGPEGAQYTRSLSLTDMDNWQAEFMPDKEGHYSVELKVRAKSKQATALSYTLPLLEFDYSVEGGLAEEKKPFVEPSPEVESPEVESPEPEAQVEEQPSKALEESAEPEEPALAPWMLYAAVGLGNVLLLALGYIAFKKIMGGPKSDILDELEEKDEAEEAPEAEAEEELVEEEPPMEDLDPDVSPEEPEPIQEASPDPVDALAAEEVPPAPAQEESAIDDEPLMDAMEEAIDAVIDEADQGEVADDLDDLDDLDAMAMQEPEPQESQEEPATEEEEEEDMVQAMLEAQGLDLAEEELDDAISSLIDDLEDDEDEKP
ncbi:VWA domain-containing protein [Agaribacterium sp. ZY112]|uniref:VWA domain-containing protein n=1 Tax=Agaribacterium sp. ZY112 TaxID=3233574 RepID=UPI00352544B3